MQEEYITITEYCRYHKTDASFIYALEENGLIEILMERNEKFISFEQLPQLENFTRWHHELGINIEGIDVIHELLQRIEALQQQLNSLKGKISFDEI